MIVQPIVINDTYCSYCSLLRSLKFLRNNHRQKLLLIPVSSTLCTSPRTHAKPREYPDHSSGIIMLYGLPFYDTCSAGQGVRSCRALQPTGTLDLLGVLVRVMYNDDYAGQPSTTFQ